MIRSSIDRFAHLAIALLLMTSTGCLWVERQEALGEKGAVYVTSAAESIRGVSFDRVTVTAGATAPDVPLTSKSVRTVAQNAKSAVLSLYVETSTPYRVRLLPIRLPLPGISVTLKGIGLGSGFFVHPDGLVVTNNHVVEDANRIRALTSDGTDLELEVIARDSAYDLAILAVKEKKGEFPYLRMGDSDAIDAGDYVVALGNPLGLGHTVTSGIISHTGRNLTGVVDGTERHIDFIQTDTAINEGSSGGPLVTLSGAWVGVNTAKLAESQGIGFAVPSKQVKEFIETVISGKAVSAPSP